MRAPSRSSPRLVSQSCDGKAAREDRVQSVSGRNWWPSRSREDWRAAETGKIQAIFRRRSHRADLDISQRILQGGKKYIPCENQTGCPNHISHYFECVHSHRLRAELATALMLWPGKGIGVPSSIFSCAKLSHGGRETRRQTTEDCTPGCRFLCNGVV